MKYEREWIDVGALLVGNAFEHPQREDTICRCDHHSLVDEDRFHLIGYSIVEGCLHWPVIYLPPQFQVVLLTPTTTYIKMGGKDFIDSLVDQHGVSDG